MQSSRVRYHFNFLCKAIIVTDSIVRHSTLFIIALTNPSVSRFTAVAHPRNARSEGNGDQRNGDQCMASSSLDLVTTCAPLCALLVSSARCPCWCVSCCCCQGPALPRIAILLSLLSMYDNTMRERHRHNRKLLALVNRARDPRSRPKHQISDQIWFI